MGRLFSASDDGKVSLWDLHSEKLMQKYQNFDETGNINGTATGENTGNNYQETQVSHSIEVRGKNSCPTALSCSLSG